MGTHGRTESVLGSRRMDTCRLLNQLISIHARSLPVYLMDAAPWVAKRESHATDVLNIVAADHELTADRIAELVMERGGAVSLGAFPMPFTGLHDLSLEYLISQLVLHQRNDTQRIQQIVELLASDPVAKSVAEETLGAAKGHLESLEELLNSKGVG